MDMAVRLRFLLIQSGNRLVLEPQGSGFTLPVTETETDDPCDPGWWRALLESKFPGAVPQIIAPTQHPDLEEYAIAVKPLVMTGYDFLSHARKAVLCISMEELEDKVCKGELKLADSTRHVIECIYRKDIFKKAASGPR